MSIKVHKTTNLHKGRVFNVVIERVTLPNGAVKDLEIVRHPGAAAMVPMLEDGKVVLIKQYRHAMGKFLWEIPAGTLEPGESPVECAGRELVEEIGYEAARLDALGEILPAPGYTDEHIHVYLATGLKEVKQKLDDDEVLKVEPVLFDDAIEMIAKGDIKDAKTIVGLLMLSMRNR